MRKSLKAKQEAPTPTPPYRRAVRLKTASDIQRALARLYNDVSRESVLPVTAGKLAYIASIMLKAVETVDIEKRIEALEKIAEEKVARESSQ